MVDTTPIYELKKEQDCVLCNKKIIRYGNNASPVKTGRCCDTCNIEVVIPTRLGIVLEIKDKKEVDEKEVDKKEVDEKELKKQKKREYMREYMKKYKQNPDNYAKVLSANRKAHKKKYDNDETFRQHNLDRSKQHYAKLKESYKLVQEMGVDI